MAIRWEEELSGGLVLLGTRFMATHVDYNQGGYIGSL